jgi:hypothetical protein
MSSIDSLLEPCDGRNHLVHVRDLAEYHAGHGFVVTPQIGEHTVVRSQGEAAGIGRSQVKIGPVEEHPRLSNAVIGHLHISACFPACLRSQEPVDFISSAARRATLKLATAVPPPAQAMQDNNLVPKGAAGINRRHVADCQIEVRKIVRDVRLYDDGSLPVLDFSRLDKTQGRGSALGPK